MSTYIGVNYQYKVEGPGGHELTVYVQNLGGAGSMPHPGQQVRLEWLPEHTFVVEPSATPISEEDEEE
jgi:spermidine/putrescine transport system ATP-binding protein